jgi:hypothetical protein
LIGVRPLCSYNPTVRLIGCSLSSLPRKIDIIRDNEIFSEPSLQFIWKKFRGPVLELNSWGGGRGLLVVLLLLMVVAFGGKRRNLLDFPCSSVGARRIQCLASRQVAGLGVTVR